MWKEWTKVDCRESRELMSGAVDKQLLMNDSQGFYEHIEICGSCREEYELERLTKAYLKRKITFVDVPYDLEQTILTQLSTQKDEGFLARLISNSTFQPVLAVGLVLVLAVVLFFANKPDLIMPSSQSNELNVAPIGQQDALSIAESNFQDVLSGKFKPQVTSIATADVAAFITQNAGYPVQLPSLPSADWVGGSVSTQGGNKLAHVVYKMGENYVYICSFPRQIIDSRKVSLSSDCKSAIKNNGWFWGEDSNGDTQAAWSNDDHVCIATANIEKKDLAAYLRPGTATEH